MGINVTDKQLFEIFTLDKAFFNYYLSIFFKRYLQTDEITPLLNAFTKYHYNKIIDIKDFIDLADSINQQRNIHGLRTYETDVSQGGSFVYRKLNTIISMYNGFWSDIDPIEKEAMLHIQLNKLNPFPENNAIIIDLILISNLIHENIPPAIIENKNKYNQSLETGDGLLLRELIVLGIENELNKISNLYKEYYKLDKAKDIKEIIMLKV